jgi:hypothetical protein
MKQGNCQISQPQQYHSAGYSMDMMLQYCLQTTSRYLLLRSTNNDSCHGWFQARKKASLDAPRPQAAFPIRRRSAHGLKPLSPLDETPLYAKFRCFHASKTNNIHILKTLFGPVIMLDLQVPALAKSPFNLSDSSHAARDCPRNAKP